MAKYIVAHPDALIVFETLPAARAQANKRRSKRPVKIFEVREVESWPAGKAKQSVVDASLELAKLLEKE